MSGEQKKTLISGPLTGGETLPAVKIVSVDWKFQTSDWTALKLEFPYHMTQVKERKNPQTNLLQMKGSVNNVLKILLG